MKKNEVLFISFVVPTYNAEKHLDNCLRSIRKQTYPKEKYEILVVDGGSRDNTLKIANQFNVKILRNPHRDAESGKAIGISKAKGSIIALVDSDNELVEKNWLLQMIKPLQEDDEVFGVESQWLVKKNDPSLNQYLALLRVADPLARKLQPRFNMIDKKDYIIYEPKIGEVPIIGANGFLYRKNFINKIELGEKFEEVNFISKLANEGFIRYAIPKNVGIYHYHVSSIGDYVRKRIKTGVKFMLRKSKGQRTWVDQVGKKDIFFSVIYNISIIGPLFEAITEYRRSKNSSWFWHPLISFLTIVVYALVLIPLWRYKR